MEGLFKSFGKGLLYIFVLPFFLLVMAGYALVGLIAFIFLFFKSIILFFCGRSLDIELPEDKKAKAIIQNAIPASSNPVFNQGNMQQPLRSNVPSEPTPTPVMPAPVNTNQHSVEEACFNQDKTTTFENDEETQAETNNHQVPLQKEAIPSIDEKENGSAIAESNDSNIQPNNISEKKYSPKKTSLIDEPIEEDDKKIDDSHNGIDIDFKDF